MMRKRTVSLFPRIQLDNMFEITISRRRSCFWCAGAVLAPLLLLSVSSYAQTATQKQTTQTEIHMAQLASARPAAAPQDASAEIRPFRVNIPDEQLADLRRRIVATRFPDKETV